VTRLIAIAFIGSAAALAADSREQPVIKASRDPSTGETVVRAASERLILGTDCRSWVELVAVRAGQKKSWRYFIALTRWSMDANRWSNRTHPTLLLDGKPVAAKIDPYEAHGIETVDCAGTAESLGLEVTRGTIVELRKSRSALLLAGTDRIDLKSAFNARIDPFLEQVDLAPLSDR
jgi:hypothetical protein